MLDEERAKEVKEGQGEDRTDHRKIHELEARVEELEGALDVFVEGWAEREKQLTEQIRLMAKVLRRRDRYIKELEQEEEEMEERMERLRIKALGIACQARSWNAREQELLARMKEENLLVIHLKQREQLMASQQKELRQQLARSEERVRESEAEVEQWMLRYQTVKEEANLLKSQALNGVKGEGEPKGGHSHLFHHGRIAELERLLKEQIHTAEMWAEKYEAEKKAKGRARSSTSNTPVAFHNSMTMQNLSTPSTVDYSNTPASTHNSNTPASTHNTPASTHNSNTPASTHNTPASTHNSNTTPNTPATPTVTSIGSPNMAPPLPSRTKVSSARNYLFYQLK